MWKTASGLLLGDSLYICMKFDDLLLLFLQDIVKNFRVWRIFASAFAFQSTPELLFGLYLTYYFRVFERQIGSNKYSVSTFPFCDSLLY